MKRSNIFTYLFLIISAFSAQAQSLCDQETLPREKVSLHLDRNIALTGDTLWFKAWCFLDGRLDHEMSKVLYVELFDETQKSIVREKFLLNNHTATGAIRIPEDVTSKYYFLKAYTSYMRNFSSADFHYQQVIIVNPGIENGTQQDGLSSAESVNPNQAPAQAGMPIEHELTLTLNKAQVQPREPLSFKVESLTPIKGTLTATVRLKGLGHQPAPEVLSQNQWLLASCQQDPFCRVQSTANQLTSKLTKTHGSSPISDRNLTWLPETRGLTITGFIENEQGERVADASALVAAVQGSPMVYVGTTDEKGAFTINLQHMQQQKDLFIGTPNETDRVLVRNDFDTNLPEINFVPFQFEPATHRLLEALNLHQQLSRTYPKQKTSLAFQADPIVVPKTNIMGPDRTVLLSDFIQVSSMAEVFNEIAAGVFLRKKDGKEILSIFDPDQQKWYDSPLILLDNVPVFNIASLKKLDPAGIEAIDIYNSDYIIGDYTIGGIISIVSKTENFNGYEWGPQNAFTTFKCMAEPPIFEQPVQSGERHHPDFRPVLFWQPELTLNPQLETETIPVFTSDQPGVYEVEVRGYTASGAPCMGYATFEVVQPR